MPVLLISNVADLVPLVRCSCSQTEKRYSYINIIIYLHVAGKKYTHGIKFTPGSTTD